MCIDQQTSLNSFLLSIFASIFLIFRNNTFDIGNAVFIISFTTIQLLEYFIWKNINIPENNEYYTRLIPLVLFIQPIVQTYFAYKFTLNNTLYNLLIVYIIMFVYIFVTINNFNYQSTIGPNKHLIWYKIDKITKEQSTVIKRHVLGYIYLIGMGIGLWYTGNYLLLSYGILSFMYIFINYPEDEFSSMWCFVAIVYSLLCL